MKRFLLCGIAICLVLCSGCVNKYEQVTIFPTTQSFIYNITNINGGTPGRVADTVAIKPGENALLADLEGPGIIHHFWCTLRSESTTCLAEQVLRIHWDDEKTPSVEVPLGDFFTAGFGKERPVQSFFLEMIPDGELPNHAALTCYIPMPFKSRALISLENQGAKPVSAFKYKINYQTVDTIPGSWGRLHARWNRENPVQEGGPYTILDTKGEGRYLGTVMNYHLLEPGAWSEGGEDFYIDHDKEPTLPGIGAEDYFGMSGGFRKEYGTLYHGTSYGPDKMFMSAYRFHVLDPIYFREAIKVTMRCHGWNVLDRADDYSSVAFWYQAEPHTSYEPLPPLEERIPETLLKNPIPPTQ